MDLCLLALLLVRLLLASFTTREIAHFWRQRRLRATNEQ